MRSQHWMINAGFVLLKRRENETVGRFERLTGGGSIGSERARKSLRGRLTDLCERQV